MPYKDPEQQKAAQRAHYQANKAEYYDRSKAWKKAHPEKTAEARRRWKARHPDVNRRIGMKSKHKKISVEGFAVSQGAWATTRHRYGDLAPVALALHQLRKENAKVKNGTDSPESETSPLGRNPRRASQTNDARRVQCDRQERPRDHSRRSGRTPDLQDDPE